jgi:rhamnulokinase
VRVIAVDLGATSIRVASVDLDATPPRPEIVHRWLHGPVRHADGSLRWNWNGIMREIRRGIRLALRDGPAASIGVDGWAVDYALLDARGRLLSPPYSYRDPRTETWEATADRIGRAELYSTTGIQLMPINTIFQLAAHDPDELQRASRLLLLPDLAVHELTGYEGAELSNASTTALVDPRTREWCGHLLDAIGVRRDLMPPMHVATEPVGSYRDVPVHLVGSHDTASAFVATPGIPGPATAVVSSGTWVLVGSERREPDTSAAANAANFSSELGALGGVRFLRNVMGFWLLEQCRARWGNPPVEELVEAAAAIEGPVPTVDATDKRFLAPADMEAEVRAAAGLGVAAPRSLVTRCILESIALATGSVVRDLGALIGRTVEELFIVGGAARIRLMNVLYERHCGVPVRVGSPEATALGNALVQGIALGRFSDLDEARATLSSPGSHRARVSRETGSSEP